MEIEEEYINIIKHLGFLPCSPNLETLLIRISRFEEYSVWTTLYSTIPFLFL